MAMMELEYRDKEDNAEKEMLRVDSMPDEKPKTEDEVIEGKVGELKSVADNIEELFS